VNQSYRIVKYKVWISQAFHDLQAAKISLEKNLFDWATYQAVQAAEKVFKAAVTLSGVDVPKTHKLTILYNIVKSSIPISISINRLRKMELFTYLARYPFIDPNTLGQGAPFQQITELDARETIDMSAVILEQINSFAKGEEFLISRNIELEFSFPWSDVEVNDALDNIIQKIITKFKHKKYY